MDRHFESLRLLEIGDRTLFSEVFPDNTWLFWTGNPKITPAVHQQNFCPASALSIMREMQRGNFDLVICHAPLHNPLHLRRLLRLFGKDPRAFPASLFRNCGFLFVRFFYSNTPLVVLDTEDYSGVMRHNFFLFAQCKRFFKRELPPDRWKIFSRTLHPNVPSLRFRRKKRFAQAIDKLRPLSLGISEKKLQEIEALQPVGRARTKTTDIFFAGTIGSSYVRQKGIQALQALQRRGYRVDIAEERLDRAEFYKRTTAAWLTWSPEGFGWDCFRHYEAAACGSVPVMNYPTIDRYRPLQQGIHALYYPLEGDGLVETVEAALRDREGLREMARRARDFVLQYHTQRRLCEYIVQEALLIPNVGVGGAEE